MAPEYASEFIPYQLLPDHPLEARGLGGVRGGKFYLC